MLWGDFIEQGFEQFQRFSPEQSLKPRLSRGDPSLRHIRIPTIPPNFLSVTK